MPSLIERFEKRVRKTDGCWLWPKPGARGYGVIGVEGKIQYAHRVSHQVYKGPVPEGLVVMHSCDNRACVNPDHLSLGTQRDNLADMWAKGRASPPPRQGFGDNSPNHKLCEAEVLEIKTLLQRGDLSMKEIAKQFGVCPPQISKINSGKRWGHLCAT